MERTELKNTVGTPDEPGMQWWRVRLGTPQIRCPYCDKFFKLGKDFEIDDDGNVLSVVYHFCDDEAHTWVVLPKLVGWKS